MMDMRVQAGRRLQDVAVGWRENQDRRGGRKQQHADIRRSRMSCADSVRTFDQHQDWTRGMEISPSGRFQEVEEQTGRQKVISGNTIRWDVAIVAIILACVLVAGILLADVAGIGISSRNISRLGSKIDLFTQKNEQLRQEVSYSSGDVSVCTEAVKLNLIASGGAKTIRLTAPQDATLILAASEENAGPAVTAVRQTGIVGD